VAVIGACVQTADRNFREFLTFSPRTKQGRPTWEEPISLGVGAQRLHGAKVQRSWTRGRSGHEYERPCGGCFQAGVCGLRFAYFAVLLLGIHFPLAKGAVCADQTPTEYQVKAAYLFNFLKFVEWPDDPGADPHGKWIIGFAGESPIADELIRLVEGKNVLGRELQVKKFQGAENLRDCNILFISETEKKRLQPILGELRGSSVLTVADMSNFVGSGGMIQFQVVDARVRVAIDVGATGRARLKVSSKLLSLATMVAGPERGANN